MRYKKGMGVSAGVFAVVGIFVTLLAFGTTDMFIGVVSGQTGYYEDTGAIENDLIPNAEVKCSDIASESRSSVSTSIEVKLEFTEVKEMRFDPNEDKFVWETDQGSGEASLSGSCDYVFRNTRTDGLEIGEGRWTITITGEKEDGQATVFMRADD